MEGMKKERAKEGGRERKMERERERERVKEGERVFVNTHTWRDSC